MIIQIDSREKARAIKKIVAEFDSQGIKHPVSKLTTPTTGHTGADAIKPTPAHATTSDNRPEDHNLPLEY